MIGIFDSGSGGLSVLRAIRKILPKADILYFGDIRNAPYGEKTQEELSELTIRAILFLQKRGASSIVSACNSVSASLALSLFDVLNFSSNKLVEMVGPTVNYFRERNESPIICATPATVRAGIYQSGFRMIGKNISTVAVPGLAGAIEFGAQNEKNEDIIRNAFSDITIKDGDTLLLGCTHYPLITNIFTQIFGKEVKLFDPAEAVAERVLNQFSKSESGNGELHFVITKDSDNFRARVAEFFPESECSIDNVYVENNF